MAATSSSSSFVFFLCIFLFFAINPSSSVQVCKPASCGCGPTCPPVRFPFRLIGYQDKSCGYPGFDLYCNNSQTILHLPRSGEFVVQWINYSRQAMIINDPGPCFSERILNFSAAGSALRAGPGHKYKFFNCSGDSLEYRNILAVPLLCSDYNFTILVKPYWDSHDMPPTCSLMPNVSIPLQLIEYAEDSFVSIDPTLELIWKEPACQTCEQNGLYCGLESDSELDIGCSKPPGHGLSRAARYGIILGVGIPGLMCAIGLLCYVLGKFRNLGRRRSFDATGSWSAMVLNPSSQLNISGLDAPTIESYPKTIIGESCRLPQQCDGSCPICLSDYQPKETLRSIPECNHYFHASCIDEWLRRNGTCPLCRNSLESNSVPLSI